MKKRKIQKMTKRDERVKICQDMLRYVKMLKKREDLKICGGIIVISRMQADRIVEKEWEQEGERMRERVRGHLLQNPEKTSKFLSHVSCAQSQAELFSQTWPLS